jgi:hypothetical protein
LQISTAASFVAVRTADDSLWRNNNYVVRKGTKMGGMLNATQIPAGGSGDTTAGEYLRETDIREYFEGTETVQFLLTNQKKGIKHERDGETNHVTPGSGFSAVAAITDERVLLAVGDSADEEHPEIDRNVSLPYTEIRSVETSRGMLKSRLTITARTSDRYHFMLGGREDLEEPAECIRRGINYWVGVEQRLSKAKDHLSTVEDHLDSGQPREATAAYRQTRELLNEAATLASEYRSGTHAMHRRIEQLETRLTMTELRGHRTRGHQLVTSAESARSQDDYRQAHDDYAAALDQYERTIALARETDHHELDEIEAEHESAQEAVGELESEPLDEAVDACETAVASDEPAVDAWEAALEKTHSALAISLRYDRFDGDPESLRYQVEWAAANLISARQRRAETAEKRGDETADEEAGREAYEQAHSDFAAARDVASEFRAGDAEALAASRARVADKAESLGEPLTARTN